MKTINTRKRRDQEQINDDDYGIQGQIRGRNVGGKVTGAGRSGSNETFDMILLYQARRTKVLTLLPYLLDSSDAVLAPLPCIIILAPRVTSPLSLSLFWRVALLMLRAARWTRTLPQPYGIGT
jgi:hypothetical protein